MTKPSLKFWGWYEKYYSVNIYFAAVLFSWQLIHLYWLSTDVVAVLLLETSYWKVSGLWKILIIIVDYTEIPALLSVSLVYISKLRMSLDRNAIMMLFFTNIQWLHLFWITDKFVIAQFKNSTAWSFPDWLGWLAIIIDYLELPVIYDIVKQILAMDKYNLIAKEGPK